MPQVLPLRRRPLAAGGLVAAVSVVASGVGDVGAVTVDAAVAAPATLEGDTVASPGDGIYESCSAALGDFDKFSSVIFTVVADGIDPAPVINEDLLPVAVITFDDVGPVGGATPSGVAGGETVECALDEPAWDDVVSYLDHLNVTGGLDDFELDDNDLLRLFPYPGIGYPIPIPIDGLLTGAGDLLAAGAPGGGRVGTLAEFATSVDIRIETTLEDVEVSWTPNSIPVWEVAAFVEEYQEQLLAKVEATGIPGAAGYLAGIFGVDGCDDDDPGADALEEAMSEILGVNVSGFDNPELCGRVLAAIVLEAQVAAYPFVFPEVTVTVTGAPPGPTPGPAPGPGPDPGPSPATPKFTG